MSPFLSRRGCPGGARFRRDGWESTPSPCLVSSEGDTLFGIGVDEGKILSTRSDKMAEESPSARSAASSEGRTTACQSRRVQPVEGSVFQVMSHWHQSSSLAMHDVSVNVAGGKPWTRTGTAVMMP